MKKWFYVLTERLTGIVTNQFIAVSETSRLRGLHYGFYVEKNCDVIRSGVDFSSFQARTADKSKKKMELGLKPSDKIVGVVAGFKPPKGLHHFLDVARKVVDRRPETTFLMVGDGELRAELESQVRKLSLDRAVKMLGWRRDIPDLLQIFDVFLLTSQWEGLPKVLLEAMSLGVPIVATAVDGVGEVVHSGENGYLTSPDNTTEMTERVLELLENEPLRVSMGRRSQLMLEPFSAQKMVQDYSNLYLRMMNQAHQT
jgi:glycosyltransferase involved in cell wall biosynthesis